MSEAIEYRATPVGVGAGKPLQQLQTMLVDGEVVIAHAMQHRIYALTHRRNLAAATSGRFIFLKRPLLGGYLPVTLRWQDIKAAEITVGMFSAEVVLTYSGNLSDTAGGEGHILSLRASGLTIDAAQALYRECQAQEQSWREKRRVRTIEEMRAQAGGVQIATGVYPQNDPPHVADGRTLPLSATDNPVDRLARAKTMLDQGLISDSEYEAIKAKIVGSL